MTISQERRSSSTRQMFSLVYVWSLLRAPETFTLTLIAMAAVLSLAFVIPQQPTALSSEGNDALETWLASLPGFYQSTAPIFLGLGLFRIFETPWFWLPTGILVLVALVILADYTPLVKQRLFGTGSHSDTAHLHPFNRFHTQSIRVAAPIEANRSAASGDPISQLQASLTDIGYRIYYTDGQDLRIFSRNHLRWGSPLLVMAGIVLFMLGVLLQSLWGDHQVFDLSISKKDVAYLDEQAIRIQTFNAYLNNAEQPSGGEIIVDIGQGPQTWMLHQPQRMNGWWIIPSVIQPSAEIRLAYAGSPEQQIEAKFPTVAHPTNFIFPQENLHFSLYYRPSQISGIQPTYELFATKLDGSDAPVEQKGIGFEMSAYNLRGQVRISEMLQLHAYKLPGLIPLTIGLLIIIVGLVIFGLPAPNMIWLKLVTKGRGSRIEAGMETLREMPPYQNDFSPILALHEASIGNKEEANGQ